MQVYDNSIMDLANIIECWIF